MEMALEQLMKLAEIAGISPLDEVDVLGRTALYAWVPTPFNQFVRTEWLPNVKIEQAMLVAEAFYSWELANDPEWKKTNGKYICAIHQKSYRDSAIINRGKTPAEAICAAVLAIGG